MGRSSKNEAVRTRVRIVEKAAELFRSSGIDQVSLGDVMAALGMTKGGFYKHFSSKEALVAEAVELAFEQSFLAWEAVGGGDDPAQERAALVDYYLRRNPQRRCPMIAFSAHGAAPAGEGMRKHYGQGSTALLERFARKKEGEAPLPSPESDPMVLFTAMIGARVLMEATGDAGWTLALRQAVLNAAGVPDQETSLNQQADV